MFRRLLLTLAFMSVWGQAQAATFTDTLLFPSGSVTFTTVPDSAAFSWTHDLRPSLGSFTLQDIRFEEAVLAVSYSQTHTNESWQLGGIGNLMPSSTKITTEFALGPGLLDFLDLNGFLTVMANESTAGADSFRIFESQLRGRYEPKPETAPDAPQAPEPGAGALVALGLWLARRKLGWQARRR